MTTNFFDPLSFVAVFGSGIRDPRSGIRGPGSGMGKNQDPGSGINIPDPQHWPTVFQIRRISKFMDLPDQDTLVRGPDQNHQVKIVLKKLYFYCFVTSLLLFILEE